MIAINQYLKTPPTSQKATKNGNWEWILGIVERIGDNIDWVIENLSFQEDIPAFFFSIVQVNRYFKGEQKRTISEQKFRTHLRSNLHKLDRVDFEEDFSIQLLHLRRYNLMSFYRSNSKQPSTSKKTSVIQDSVYRETLTPSKDLRFVGKGSEDTIEFIYYRGETYSLSNRDIVFKNDSHTHYISFQIQCNNPTHYKVHPVRAEIPPNKTVQIEIQIVDLQEVAEIGRSFFAKFLNDKFKISWHSYREGERSHLAMNNRTSSLRQFVNQKIFKVNINFHEKSNDEEEVRKKPTEFGEKVQESLSYRRRELVQLQNMILEKEIEKVDESWISCGLVWVMSLLAFLMGVLLPL